METMNCQSKTKTKLRSTTDTGAILIVESPQLIVNKCTQMRHYESYGRNYICKPGGLRWHSRMPTECPIWKINSVSHLSRASLTLVFTDVEDNDVAQPLSSP